MRWSPSWLESPALSPPNGPKKCGEKSPLRPQVRHVRATVKCLTEPKISRRASHQATFPIILFWGLSWWFFFQGVSSLLRSGVPHVPRRGGIFLPQDNADDIRRENAIARDALAEDPLGTRGVIEDGSSSVHAARHTSRRGPRRERAPPIVHS